MQTGGTKPLWVTTPWSRQSVVKSLSAHSQASIIVVILRNLQAYLVVVAVSVAHQ